MSISNLSSSVSALPNLFPAPFTSNNNAVIPVSVGVPLSATSKVLVLAKSVAGGADALAVGSVNDVSAYNVATPNFFSVSQDGLNLNYKGGAADATQYYVKVYQ